jgi:hypothetical protein
VEEGVLGVALLVMFIEPQVAFTEDEQMVMTFVPELLPPVRVTTLPESEAWATPVLELEEIK